MAEAFCALLADAESGIVPSLPSRSCALAIHTCIRRGRREGCKGKLQALIADIIQTHLPNTWTEVINARLKNFGVCTPRAFDSPIVFMGMQTAERLHAEKHS